MNKLYFSAMGLIFGVAVFFLLRYGVGPRPIGIMKPTEFERGEQIGAVVYRRLRQDFRNESRVVLGVQPATESHLDMISGFLRTAAAEGGAYDVLILDPRLPGPRGIPPLQVMSFDLNKDAEQIANVLKVYHRENKRVVLVTANHFSTHLIKENPIHRLETILQKPILAISLTQLALRRDEERKLEPPCVGGAHNVQGTAPLGCAILRQSQRLYRKNLTPKAEILATMEQHGLTDYLLFIHGNRPSTELEEH
jgi:hypothetical protein